jgi:hypothetical protein
MNHDKITEKRDKWLVRNVEIHKIDYDLPVNLWYTYKFNKDEKIYFYIHVSSTSNYKGVIFAAVRSNVSLLSKIKNQAIQNYSQTCGRISAAFSPSGAPGAEANPRTIQDLFA